ncbi:MULTISPECIES: peptidoglycan recognition family protein [Actinosynnema]|uniref:peptidoglycan recognition protein family protein n=1 Tax=Actinosynnema TaxID=40566 RepID=UPI0020A2345D|nr:peptidoglycan recognition family protein [Actinosynnema pretiosum]MCP2098571.1 N-acetylmuramoyl-L-alanine amidase [Actinosynnema pretiosum]
MTDLSRRSVLRGAFAAGAAALAAGAVVRTAQATPATGPAALAAGRSTRPVGPASTHLSVASGGGRWRTRTASGWGDWRTLASCPAGHENPAHARALLPLGPGVVEYEVDVPTATSVTELSTSGATARSTGEARIAGRATGKQYFPRAAWGADESLRFREDGSEAFPAAYFPVQTLTVHHTALPVGADPAADIRAIYRDHAVNQDFGDIGYHLLIDPQGGVYEGRWSGTDQLPVFGEPDGGAPRMSNGAHVGGYNAGNVGVCVMGDFTTEPPSAQAVDSLVAVLAAISKACGLDPLGRKDHVNPISGATKSVDTISGHRDWLATQCPGERFFPELAGIRAEVAKRVSGY